MDRQSSERKNPDFFLVLSAVLCLPIWIFRYPAFADLPTWLLEVSILRNLHSLGWGRFFSVTHFPIPKLTFLLSTYFLSFLCGLDIASRIVITCMVLSFVGAFRYLVRCVGQKEGSPLELIGFFLCYNGYFITGVYDYFFGLSVYFFLLGFLWKRAGGLDTRGRLIFFAGTILLYLTHFFVYFLFCLTLVFLYSLAKQFRPLNVRSLCTLLSPTALVSVLFLWLFPDNFRVKSFGVLSDKFAKLLALVVPYHKYYPFEMPFPTLAMNCVYLLFWMVMAALLIRAGLRINWRSPFFYCSAFFLPCAILLPAGYGSSDVCFRFVLPMYVLFLLSLRFGDVPRLVKPLLTGAFLIVMLFQLLIFSCVDRQIRNQVEAEIRLIPPQARQGLVYEYYSKYPRLNRVTPWVSMEHTDRYYYLHYGIPYRLIFGTSIVTPRTEALALSPQFARLLQASDLVGFPFRWKRAFSGCDFLVIRGRLPEIKSIARIVEDGFDPVYWDTSMYIMKAKVPASGRVDTR